MRKVFMAALVGGALAAAGPALAQSGGTGGLSGGSPGSPGAGPGVGTSTPNMGPSATTGVSPGMREGAPSPTGRSASSAGQRGQQRRADAVRAHDLDRDGTLDLAETKSAAAKRYDRLNPDLDDALDRREAQRHSVPAATFRAADADGNGVVTKAEWLALVEKRFQAADPDNDGTVSRAELRSDKGKVLARFMR